MKNITFLTIAFATATSFASAKPFEWVGPKDMSLGCGNAIVKKLSEDKDVSQYLVPSQDISLEWYDHEKTAVSFTQNFDEDVRDGYITGEIEVKVARGGYCIVKAVKNYDVGD